MEVRENQDREDEVLVKQEKISINVQRDGE